MTIAYTTYVYQSPFGVLTVEEDRITGVVEKPTVDYPISTGIYALRGSVLNLVPGDGSFYTMPQLAGELLARGMGIGAFRVRDFWLGMEHMESFDQAIRELDRAGALP
jgi:NDP-sugar pyrophosphorylase family protein